MKKAMKLNSPTSTRRN